MLWGSPPLQKLKNDKTIMSLNEVSKNCTWRDSLLAEALSA